MSKDKPARVYHADLWGTREHKYKWLESHDVANTPWKEIEPLPELYLFVPREEEELERYNTFSSVTDIFEKYSVGIVTARDHLTIHWTPEQVWITVLNFSRMDPELARQAYQLGDKVSTERIQRAQKDVSDPSRDKVVPILYRPFDVRYTYYTGQANGFHERPRPEVMRHMLAGENLALIVPRLNKGDFGAFTTMNVGGHKTVAAFDINYYFPLYLYPDAAPQTMFGTSEPKERRPNIKPGVFECLAGAYGEAPTPERVFCYIYAALYAPSYRTKYADFLRLDFPRIPFTSDYDLFEQMAALGNRLVDLHLLRSAELDPPIARFQGEGDGKVATGKKGVRYDPESARVYINETQYFEGVPPEVWEYQIGGYQVCHKWLKDRQDRKLSLAEIRTYCRIVTASPKPLTFSKKSVNFT